MAAKWRKLNPRNFRWTSSSVVLKWTAYFVAQVGYLGIFQNAQECHYSAFPTPLVASEELVYVQILHVFFSLYFCSKFKQSGSRNNWISTTFHSPPPPASINSIFCFYHSKANNKQDVCHSLTPKESCLSSIVQYKFNMSYICN